MEVKAKRKYHSKHSSIKKNTRLFTMLIGQKEMESVGLDGFHFDCYAKSLGITLKFDLDQIFPAGPQPYEPKKLIPVSNLQWSMKFRAIITGIYDDDKETDPVFDSSGESAGVITDFWGITQTRQNICSQIVGENNGGMNKFLSNGGREHQALTLEAEVEIIAKIHDDRETVRIIDIPRTKALDVLELLRKDASDISIKCDSEEIKAHKLVLTTYSPVFARMLDSPMNESVTNVINIDDFEPKTVQNMIAFMYEGTLNAASKVSIVALLDCAEKYDISELKVAVVKKMLSMITPENGAEFAAAVTKFRGDEKSKQEIFDYCKANFSKLSTNSHFRRFFKENVQFFL